MHTHMYIIGDCARDLLVVTGRGRRSAGGFVLGPALRALLGDEVVGKGHMGSALMGVTANFIFLTDGSFGYSG